MPQITIDVQEDELNRIAVACRAAYGQDDDVASEDAIKAAVVAFLKDTTRNVEQSAARAAAEAVIVLPEEVNVV